MKSVPKFACNYAVLQFLPYPETREFVNIGVAMHCPAQGVFDMRIENRKVSRVTDFFPELDRVAYKAARDAMEQEMRRVRDTIARGRIDDRGRKLFCELVRPRETIFRFGETRTILTNDLTNLANELFALYVKRHFAQPKEYQETVMAERFFKVLQKELPGRVFRRNKLVGTKEYHVRIPICSDLQTKDEVPYRAIKPLDLQRTEPTAVFEHGDAWIQRVKRLKEIDRLPERFIFATRVPSDDRCASAAAQVLGELKDQGAILIPENDTEGLLKLAAD